MLYDKRWERPKTEDEIYSLAGLIAWLETMDPNENYNFMCVWGECAVGQYLASRGQRNGPGSWNMFVERVPVVTERKLFSDEPWTFGAALERCRKASS